MMSSNTPAARLPGLWFVLIAAAGVFALTMGTRQTLSLFLGPLNTATGLGLASISLAFAVGQLGWGLTQPFAGAIADRYGAGRVLLTGMLLVVVGIVITPWMTSTLGLILAIGVLSAGGAGMAGPAVLMGATNRLVSRERWGLASGIVNAGGSFGQFAMAPIAGGLLVAVGWANAMQIMGLIVLLALPAAWILRGTAVTSAAASTPTAGAVAAPMGFGASVAMALRDPSYRLLSAGFFVCGFHVAFLATHLPGVVASCDLPVQFSAWALGVLGLFNIVGSVAIGWAMGRWRMKSLLSFLYAVRGVAVLVFVLAPKNGVTVLVFAAVMGVTLLSTVPPTAGLVAKFFGPARIATLFGVVMLVHQVGAFLGAWLGGQVFEATGSYDWFWYVDILLAAGAALVHLPIREAPLAPAPTAAAAR
jgi:MFS family permease